MGKTIKHQHDAFGAYGQYNDWGFSDPEPTVEVFINNGRERAYVNLSLKEATQALEILKDAVKEAEKEGKKQAKIKKRRGSKGSTRF